MPAPAPPPSVPAQPAAARPASRWVTNGRDGASLSTLTRACIVAAIWLPAWAWSRQWPAAAWPRWEIEPSTVMWFITSGAVIALLHALRGPDVQGRPRLIWDAVTLAAFATWTFFALERLAASVPQ